MTFESAGRIVRLGFTNFWRNRWLSLAATLIMTLTLLIISTFVILSLVINKTTDVIRAKMDISVYFKDTASAEQILDLQRQLVNRKDVGKVVYISKEEALEIFKEQQKGKAVAQVIDPEENPLPRSLEVKAGKPEDLENIAGFINQDQYKTMIDNVSYQDNATIIKRLIAITSFIKQTGWILSAVFILISILVILNTIRLTIFTRKEEIEIMRLVGASDSFIKIPFVIEGFFYGFIATIVATLTLVLAQIVMAPRIEKSLGLAVSERMANFFAENFLIIFGLELLVGLLIGILCSLFSIRKYLKV